MKTDKVTARSTGVLPSEGQWVPTERQIQETVARCVSIMVFYHSAARTSQATERMTAEVQVMAGWVSEWKMGKEEIDELLVRPVGDELLARYGPELGPRLNRLFLEAFDGLDSAYGRS